VDESVITCVPIFKSASVEHMVLRPRFAPVYS
jgi:hypothetical protein